MDNGLGERAADIESKLRPDWWKDIFDATYLVTDADAVEVPEITIAEVDALLEATNVTTADPILDLCCGQGRHCIELLDRGFTVTGVDGSAYLIGVAQERAGGRGRFFVDDVRRAHPRELGQFKLVTMMGNSFGYLEDESADLDVLWAAYRLLKPGGTVYLDVADGAWLRENFSPTSWEWVAQNKMVARERKLSGDRLVSREMVIDTHKGIEADRTYAERLYSRERICDLLRQVGFENVQVVGTLGTAGYDPGMMAHRFTVVGTRVSKVTVLQGDPRLPDRVKPSGAFDATDLDTVARMKSALAELNGYKFAFVDDHTPETFVAHHEGDVVLNLCDEGYRNDPRSEALVAATLDALGVPYTGAPASCLVLCYDKAITRTLARAVRVSVPEEVSVLPGQPVPVWDHFPAFVKPSFGDSSVGIDATSLVHDRAALEAAVEARRCYGPVLIQEYLSGAEFSVGLLGNKNTLRALPVLWVDYSNLGDDVVPILGYESKWVAGSPWWEQLKYRESKQSRLNEEIIESSKKLFHLLGCRDYARFDWRCDASGNPKLLEVNPNPGWCWDGKMALMAEMDGKSYPWLLEQIIQSAVQRLG
jgi:D-alanine-D-alanine ligase